MKKLYYYCIATVLVWIGHCHLLFGQGVGINQTSPVSMLDVNGGVTIGSTYSGTNAAPADGMIVQGNVGIGTTTVNESLVIGKDLGTFAGNRISIGGTGFDGINIGEDNSNRAFILWEAGTDDFLKLGTRVGGVTYDDNIVLHDGAVGIGTNAPIGDAGDLTLGDNGGTQGRFYMYGSTAGKYSRIMTTNGNLHIDADVGGDAQHIYLNYYTGNHVYFGTGNGSAHSVFSSAGNLGVGNTSPAAPIHITNSIPAIRMSDTDISGYHELRSSNTNLMIRADPGAADAGSNIVFDVDNSEAMRIDADGDVGIGSTDPQYPLDVVGSTRTSGKFFGNLNVEDTRAVNDAPTVFNKEVAFEFKSRATVGVGGSGTYSGQMTFAPWGDNSGDASHQLNFNEGGLFWRQGQPDGGSWDSWKQILTDDIAPQGSGTNNYVVKWTPDGSTLGNSTIYDNGSIGIGTTGPVSNVEIYQTRDDGDITMLTLTTQGTGAIGDTLSLLFRQPATGGALRNVAKISAIHNSPANNQGNLAFFTATTGTLAEAMRIDVSGNLGIGTTAPANKLHVAGDIQAESNIVVDGSTVIDDGAGWHRSYGNTGWYNGTHGGGIYMIDATWIRTYGNKNFYHNTGVMRTDGTFQVGSGGARFVVQTDGDVGIGVTDPTYKIHVNGKVKSDGITESSDIRLKKDVVAIDKALQKVKEMEGVYFNWRTDEFPEHQFDSTLQVGLIAQQVEQILPEVVNTDGEGYKSVEYSKIVAVLIEAMKEQQQLIEQQQTSIYELKSEVEQLKLHTNDGNSKASK